MKVCTRYATMIPGNTGKPREIKAEAYPCVLGNILKEITDAHGYRRGDGDLPAKISACGRPSPYPDAIPRRPAASCIKNNGTTSRTITKPNIIAQTDPACRPVTIEAMSTSAI